MKRSSWYWLGLALSTCGLAAAQGRPQVISIGFDGRTVVVSGLTPKADVAWVGIGHVVEDAYATTVSDHGLDSADATGALSLDTSRAIPDASVWVVVDLVTGQVATGSPTPGLAKARSLPPGLIQKALGRPDSLKEARNMVEAFVARKDKGFWTLWLADGGERDLDGPSTAGLTFALDDLEAVGKSPSAPEQLVADDVVVLIDPQQLELEIGTVKP